MRAYEFGCDVLGVDLTVGDFVPWLGLVGKLAGGVADAATSKKGGAAAPTAEDKKKAEEAQKAAVQAALDKQRIEQQAKMLKWGMLGAVGVVVLGGAALVLRRK